jgi:hypothetical protein
MQVHTAGGVIGGSKRPGSGGPDAWEREALRLEAEKTALSQANAHLEASAQGMRQALESTQAELLALRVRPTKPAWPFGHPLSPKSSARLPACASEGVDS